MTEYTRAMMMPMSEDMTEEMALNMINKTAKKPMRAEDVAVYEAELSNQNVDSYATRMSETTLNNYAADFSAGRPLMNSHRTGGMITEPELPMGRIFYGRMVGTPLPRSAAWADKGGAKLRINFFIQRGLNLNGQPTNDLIGAVDGGTINDMSVGFSNGDGRGAYICSECGNDMFRSEDCTHFPGQMCNGHRVFAWVDNMRGEEGSLVYRGSTPDAAVQKAIRMFKPKSPELAALGDAWGVRFQDYATLSKEAKTMDWDKIIADLKTHNAPLAERLAVAKADDTRVDAILGELGVVRRSLVEVKAELVTAQGELVPLRAKAAIGDQYVKDLVEEAVKARVRAQGDKFDAAKYRVFLAAAGDLEFLKAEIDSYAEQARQALGTGKRPSVEAKEKSDNAARRATPSVYR